MTGMDLPYLVRFAGSGAATLQDAWFPNAAGKCRDKPIIPRRSTADLMRMVPRRTETSRRTALRIQRAHPDGIDRTIALAGAGPAVQ